ncbi:hypothetical protein DL95DRAFT_497358 [Leptodontidium sp. 2 PMI_412]|nr:hypothetical protein DL95DRAFT_497358 [Leptodontidium sp. 2 PMI_412]
MPKLPVGKCATCDAEDATLRPNPFTTEEQCEDCREERIIGVSDVKVLYKLKDEDLKGLTMNSEPQPAFLGGPDRRWYLVEEVEERAEEIEKKREKEKSDKEAAKAEVLNEKEAMKAAVLKEKEELRKEKEGMRSTVIVKHNIKRKRLSDGAVGGGDEDGYKEDDEEKPVKRGRGRPPKEKTAGKTIGSASKGKKGVTSASGDGEVKRGRGRPPKAKVVE